MVLRALCNSVVLVYRRHYVINSDLQRYSHRIPKDQKMIGLSLITLLILNVNYFLIGLVE